MESKSIMSMADDILGGMLTNPDTTASEVQAATPGFKEDNHLPDLSDADRNRMMNEAVFGEKLGRELKKHAKHGETSYSPGGSEKHTSVDISSDDAEKLSPRGKAKLKSHRQRSGSKHDQRTSWAVDRQQAHQKAKWSQESDRQRKHSGSRGKPTKGSSTEPASTKDAWSGRKSPNSSVDTIQTRTRKLSPAGREKMAQKAPAHQKRRADAYRAQRAEADQAQRDKWKKSAEEARRKQGIKKRDMQNSNLSREQMLILTQARDIMREVTSVGGIGTKQGTQVPGTRATFTQDNNGKPMGKDMVPVAPVDKSLKKTGKTLTPTKKKAKKKGKKNESLDLFLNRIISETQQGC